MPKYSYIAKDRAGNTIKDTVDFQDKTALVQELQKKDLFIVSVREVTPAAAVKRTASSSPGSRSKVTRKFTHKKVKITDLLSFARQLATMLASGVPLIRSIDVIQSQVGSEQLAIMLFKIKSDIEQGRSLSESLAKFPKTFNLFWVSLIEVGEASGTLPGVLNKLTFYIEQQAAFNQTVLSGVLYPAILFFVASGAVVFFALVVAPRFEEIFNNMHAKLPAITQMLLDLFRYIKSNFFYLVGGFVVGIFLLRKYIATYTGRLMFEKLIFKLPNIGSIYRLIIVERFSSQMAILIDAGVPILYALDITEKLVNNLNCAKVVCDIREGVRGGELLVAPMERSGFFPGMAIQMIMVGEETGELSKMLKHVSEFYQSEVETFMKRFSTIIEPVMIVFMGGIIGVIVLAMFLPMFNLSQMGRGG